MDRTSLHQQMEVLLERVAAGEESAFEDLYRLIHRRVYYFLLRMLGSKESAEDVMVETFTTVWKNAGQFAGRSAVSSWIFGIARNLGLNEIRRRKNHEDIADHPHIPGGPIPDMEQHDRKRILRQAMAVLSAKHHEIIDLVFYHEMTYPEVSDLLGIPVGTVKTRVFHAKSALKEALNDLKVDRDAL